MSHGRRLPIGCLAVPWCQQISGPCERRYCFFFFFPFVIFDPLTLWFFFSFFLPTDSI